MLNIVNRYLSIRHLHIYINKDNDDGHNSLISSKYLFINQLTFLYFIKVAPVDAYKKYFFKK